MWAILCGLALGGEPVLEGPVEAYPSVLPLRIDADERWRRADLQGANVAKAGGYVTVGGAVVSLAAVGLMALQDEAGPAVSATGGLVFLGSAPATVGGVGMLLGGSLRSRNALKKQGVRVTALPGAVGWTLLALTPYSLQIPNDQGAFAIATFGGSAALGIWQSHLNAEKRNAAGLGVPKPTPVGVAAARPRVRLALIPMPHGGAIAGAF